MTREEAIKRLQYIRAEYEEPLALNSREDVRKAIGVYLESLDMAIEALSEPPRPNGRWINGRCTNCGSWCGRVNITTLPNYCDNCGADMREEK